MAATRALPSSHQNPNITPTLKSPKPSSAAFVIKAPTSKKKKHNTNIRCEIKSFENTNNWTVEPDDPVHFLKHNSPNHHQVAMASESAVRKAKKVCLFYCAETKELAQKVAAESDAIELRSINWR